MKISDIYKTVRQPVSFEIFPPKGELTIDDFRSVLSQLKDLRPDFISVTYSAGGSGNSAKTAQLASIISKDYGISSSAHITCGNSSRRQLEDAVADMKEKGIENILALRGDIADIDNSDYRHATDIIPYIKSQGFCVGGACYAEGHISCENPDDEVKYLKMKQDLGAEFLVSQLFFDNSVFYRFFENAKKTGVTIPIIAGIMPMLGKSQITRMIFMCGASLPSAIIRLLNKYENNADDLKKAGIEYAGRQIEDLISHGVDGIHIYTMNQPNIAQREVEYVAGAKGIHNR